MSSSSQKIKEIAAAAAAGRKQTPTERFLTSGKGTKRTAARAAARAAASEPEAAPATAPSATAATTSSFSSSSKKRKNQATDSSRNKKARVADDAATIPADAKASTTKSTSAGKTAPNSKAAQDSKAASQPPTAARAQKRKAPEEDVVARKAPRTDAGPDDTAQSTEGTVHDTATQSRTVSAGQRSSDLSDNSVSPPSETFSLPDPDKEAPAETSGGPGPAAAPEGPEQSDGEDRPTTLPSDVSRVRGWWKVPADSKLGDNSDFRFGELPLTANSGSWDQHLRALNAPAQGNDAADVPKEANHRGWYQHLEALDSNRDAIAALRKAKAEESEASRRQARLRMARAEARADATRHKVAAPPKKAAAKKKAGRGPAKGKGKPAKKAKAPAAAAEQGAAEPAAETPTTRPSTEGAEAGAPRQNGADAAAKAGTATASAKRTVAPTDAAAAPEAAAPEATAAPPATAAPKKIADRTKKGAAPAKSGVRANGVEPTASQKRKADEDAGGAAPAKKARGAAKTAGRRPAKAAPAINEAPSRRLKVFVFGENGNGELGLGHENLPDKRVTNVTRPRLNPLLAAETVGVVQVATGGMHSVALTHDNRLLTWGVNDQGALGRPTKAAEQLRDADADDSDASDEGEYHTDAHGNKRWPVNTGLNPLEAAPGEVVLDGVPEGTVWTQVAAGDSVTLAVTSTGLVFGCGTFRGNDGILGFSPDEQVQSTLVQVKGLKDVVRLACGDNHALALDKRGNVWTFGSGQQNQLGRRVIERNATNGLVPHRIGLPAGRTVAVAAGAYHSFAIDKAGAVWGWGLNSFGETGVPAGAGDDGALVLQPERVAALAGRGVTALAGGAHHSLALTAAGEVLAWGRADTGQCGIAPAAVPAAHWFVGADGQPSQRLIAVPTRVGSVAGAAAHIAAASDTSFAVTEAGRAFSWGFSANYQTGQGTAEDVDEAALVDNSAVRVERLGGAGAGGQFGVLTSEA